MALVSTKSYDLEIGELIIGSVQVGEAEELIEFIREVDRETDFLIREPGEFDLSIEEEEEFIKDKEENDKELFLKAKLDGRIVGTLGFSTEMHNRYKHKGEFGMAVIKDYWGYNIGTNLLKNLLKWSDNKGYAKISLRVDLKNQRAISLYKKFGFKEEGVLKKNKYIGNGEYRDEIIMARINKNNL